MYKSNYAIIIKSVQMNILVTVAVSMHYGRSTAMRTASWMVRKLFWLFSVKDYAVRMFYHACVASQIGTIQLP